MTTNRTHRIGPRMEQAASYVASHPGCYKVDVAREVGPHGSLRYGYRTVDRAIAAGLIHAQRQPDGTYRLTLGARDAS